MTESSKNGGESAARPCCTRHPSTPLPPGRVKRGRKSGCWRCKGTQASYSRYRHSAKGRAMRSRYSRSAKGRAARARYAQSEKGQWNAAFWHDLQNRRRKMWREFEAGMADPAAWMPTTMDLGYMDAREPLPWPPPRNAD